ncbi:Growth arrest-specific protein 1 -like protein [Toxocara canis]|uniref:Growth arrest-specific protein 1-like protein n=1 Tax=Toxocara canis TaxID=6265 RepID=A0A0B2UYW2_TOXCA|nr:Growth arrest-specific protein 1 -like protein [Toxocara canis]
MDSLMQGVRKHEHRDLRFCKGRQYVLFKCNAKWGVFVSECEVDASHAQCNQKCRDRLKQTFATKQGAALAKCTCTNRDDKLCDNLKNVVLRACTTPPVQEVTPMDNSITEREPSAISPNDSTGSAALPVPQIVALTSLCVLLLFRWSLSLY